MVMLMDRAPLERVRKLADGRIAAVARFARSGVYTYSGAEVGKPHLSSVNVYRPEDEVFSQDAMASFAHKAITVGHPAQAVTADNWSAHSAGWTEGKVARDGEFVEIPLMLADASAVKAYESGQARELSAGYTSELVWGDGVAPDGTSYQATMRQIRGNHIALVPQGRAGSHCRIGDSISTGAAPMFTDAQLAAFRDSDEGREAVAYARSTHNLNAHRAGPWHGELERKTLADALSAKARGNPYTDAHLRDAQAQEHAAYLRSVAALTASRN